PVLPTVVREGEQGRGALLGDERLQERLRGRRERLSGRRIRALPESATRVGQDGTRGEVPGEQDRGAAPREDLLQEVAARYPPAVPRVALHVLLLRASGTSSAASGAHSNLNSR